MFLSLDFEKRKTSKNANCLKGLALVYMLSGLLFSCSHLSQKIPYDNNVQPIQLIISGEGHYWQQGSTETSNSDADVVVDTRRRYQTWYGTGGTFNELGWQVMLLLEESEKEKIMSLLFDSQNGIGFTWGRIPMGASDYAIDRYTLNGLSHDQELNNFSIERDKEYLIPYIKAAQQISNRIKFWASPWTPPRWMKNNNSFDRGAFNTEYSKSYAQYFVKWIKAYESQGIAIDHVQPQNEPGWSQDYPSCAWGPSGAGEDLEIRPVTLGKFVNNHLAPALEQSGLNTALWYGTLSNSKHFYTYWNDLLPEGVSKIRGVGLQWGTDQYVKEIANTTGKGGNKLLVMQTEHKCGNYPWKGNQAQHPSDANQDSFLSTMAPNNHAYAEETWELIKLWVEQGVNIYSAWNMVLDDKGFNMDKVRPWPQNALIVVNRASKTYKITPAYYVFRHFGQYLQVGAQRVSITGGNGLAFLNPDNSIVVTLFNRESKERALTIKLGGKTLTLSIPAKGWGTLLFPGDK